MEQELGCKFISIDPDKEDFDISEANNEMCIHIKELTELNPMNKFQQDYQNQILNEIIQ